VFVLRFGTLLLMGSLGGRVLKRPAGPVEKSVMVLVRWLGGIRAAL
jgi:hypothetical protein